jgi:LPXTG-motif cell wall-anchored protein
MYGSEGTTYAAAGTAAAGVPGVTMLAQTGMTTGSYALIALGAIGIGAALVTLARTRRHKGARP